MERLTIRNSDGSVSQPTSTTISAVFEKLAAYEDEEEQGRMVVLPKPTPDVDFMRVFKLIMGDYEGLVITLRCKVGDTVYQKDCYGNMYTYTVRRIIVDESKIVYDTGGIGFDETAIGVSVFLTRAEAEKATKGD